MQWHHMNHMQTICTSLQTDNHTNTPSLNFIFYRPDALPDAQPTVSKQWRHITWDLSCSISRAIVALVRLNCSDSAFNCFISRTRCCFIACMHTMLLHHCLSAMDTALGALCAQLTFWLAWCCEHSVVMATELLQPPDHACGTLFQSSCVIRTSPVDCSDDSWREAWTRRSVSSDMQRYRKTLTYLLTQRTHHTLLLHCTHHWRKVMAAYPGCMTWVK